ncbi:chromatin remodeling protein EBS-like [Quercus suber]
MQIEVGENGNICTREQCDRSWRRAGQSHGGFHPSCMGMTIEEAKKLDHFLCSDCSSDDDAKRSLNVFPVSPSVEAKVEPKRRKR